MKSFLTLLALGFLSVAHAAPNVASCATAADGTPFGTVWLPCASTVVYVGPNVPASTPVAVQRNTAGVYSNLWTLASKLQATDRVWGTPTATATAATWFTPAGVLTIGAVPAPPVTPPPTAGTGSFTLTWVPPTQNTDGSPVSLASFDIYEGIGSAAQTKIANVLAPTTTYKTPSLPPGTYTFAVTAISTAGTVSIKSNIGTGTIPPANVCPSAPANATQAVQCPTGFTGSWIQTHGWVSAAYPSCWTVGAWTPTTPPVGACTPIPPPPPASITIKCPLPTASGSVACTATAN